jgi:hypothetical protein
MPMVGEKPPADSKTAGSRSSMSPRESMLSDMILRNSGLGAIDGERQRLAQKRLVDAFQIVVERNHSGAPRLVGKARPG